MQSFSRGGLIFRFAEYGAPDGLPVVLLHGFPGSSASWAGVVAPLAEQGLRVLVPDQRGYSPQARPPGRSQYRLSELVADVIALAGAAGLGRFDLVGHDWGAIVGWAAAAAHPERVRSLVALATPHPGALAATITRGQAIRSAYVPLFWLPALPERLLLARGGAGLRALLRRSGLSRPWRERYTAAMLEPGALAGALAWYRALPPSGPPPAVGSVKVPTCFVAATGDSTVSRAALDRTGGFVDAPYQCEAVPASHWLPEQHPEVVVRLILEHLRGL